MENTCAVIDLERLAEQYVYLVPHVARRLVGQLPAGIDVGDLESVGYVGLLDGLRSIQRAELAGRPIRNHAGLLVSAIRGEMLNSLRARREVVPIDEREAPVEHTGPEERAVVAQNVALARRAIEGMPGHQRAVLYLRLVRCMSQGEAASQLRISRQTAQRIQYAAAEYLRSWRPRLDGGAALSALASWGSISPMISAK